MVTLATPKSPPGPPQQWLFGNLKEFGRDRLGVLSRWAQEYGDVVWARFGPRYLVFINHPDLVEEVLVNQNRKFIKHYRLRDATRTLGQGLLISEGDFWRGQRKLAQPAFHRERIAAYGQLMVDLTERMLATWADGQVRDAQDDMMRLTLEIVAKTLFDAEVGGDSADVSAAMETLMRAFVVRTARLISPPHWIPTPMNIRVEHAIRRLERLLLSIIAERRKSGEDRGDLLSMLLRAQDEESGRRMSDSQLRDEMMTLFMAGHETTANTLAWAWFLLSGHPEAEARLQAELDEVLGGRSPTVADLPRLPYTESVINETLRVYPTVWMLGREAIEPLELGGYPIPVGTTIFMPQWVIHRDSRWFDDPEEFRPERWRGGLMQRIHRYAYFPFGGGPRICIGNNFALMESALVLATIAQKFRLNLAPDANVTPLATITLRPAHGVKVSLSKR
ncbi:MAG TPA: cytochrome P450 [Chloroflexota bacterium]|nr:cytochrome P450 [Chloroflexota bacterium]